MTKVNCKDCVQPDCVYVGMDNTTKCKGFVEAPEANREWVGLTEEEAWEMLGQMSLGASIEDVLLVEAKLKEKNT